MNSRYRSSLGLSLMSLGFVGCADTDADVVSRSPVSEASDSIIAGAGRTTNPFAAAIAYKNTTNGSAYWGKFACSGVFLRNTAAEAYVLTARHCVNDVVNGHGNIGGPIKDRNDIKVSSAVTPGVWWSATDTSPASVTAISALANPYNVTELRQAPDGSIYQSWPQYLDMAILKLNKSMPLTGGGYVAIFPLDPSALEGRSIYAWGYGLNLNVQDAVAGQAGSLRSGGPFRIITPDSEAARASSALGTYSYTNIYNGQSVAAGDSGGPDVNTGAQVIGGIAHTWTLLYGVHSSASVGSRGTSVHVGAHWDWIQEVLGYVYISVPWTMGSNLAIASATPQEGTRLTAFLTGDSNRTRFRFIKSTGELKVANTSFCVAGEVFPALHACNSSTVQKWTVAASPSGNRVLKNNSTGTCLAMPYMGTTPALTDCSSSNVMPIAFHTQP
jgi:hypothetical protein